MRRLVAAAIGWAVESVRETVATPSAPGFERIFFPVEDGILGDPLVTLERQTALDSVLQRSEDGRHAALLTDDIAEAWVQLFGLALALIMAELDIRKESDLARLDDNDVERVQIIHFLQDGLIDALDQNSSPSGSGPSPGGGIR
jgi:hypothetical protein